MEDLSALDDNDFQKLVITLDQMVSLSDQAAQNGDAFAHRMYVLARNCQDLILFESSSRRTLQILKMPLSADIMNTLDPQIIESIHSGNTIDAIKRLHKLAKCSLGEAKNAVERYIDSMKP